MRAAVTAGPDRAGRLRALRAGPVPARRPSVRGPRSEVRRLILTASGGPFRGRRRDELTDVTPEQALAHPTWNMGPVVTINSATLVNKGLEVIEAHELFDVAYDDIEVMVHPQSVIHSMVEFVDGSTIAQCSPPDMRLPIALALGWPDRVPARPRRSTGRALTPGSSARSTTRRSPPYGWPRRPAGPGGAVRRSTTRPTRSVWPGSQPAGCRSWASSTRWRGCSRRRPISPNQVPSMTCSRPSRGPAPGPRDHCRRRRWWDR